MKRESIEFLRWAVGMFNSCKEDFNLSFTHGELVKLAEVTAVSCRTWDIGPDEWTERQVREALDLGQVPQFKYNKRCELIAVYSDETTSEAE